MRLTGTQRWLAFSVLAWTLGVTVSRAIRFPNDFAEAHWLLDYRFGFIKRGLAGSCTTILATLTGIPVGPGLIRFLSVLLAATFYGLLLVLCIRLTRRARDAAAGLLVGLVLVSSPFIVMSAHLFGYLDSLLYVLTILGAGMALHGRPIGAMVVAVAALLVHESFLLVGFPLVVFAAMLGGGLSPQNPRRFRYGAALAVPLLLFVGIVLAQTVLVDQGALREKLLVYLQGHDFIPTRAGSVARWHTTGFFEFLERQRGFLLRRLLEPTLWWGVVPSLVAVLAMAHGIARWRPLGLRSFALLAVVLAPLAMHAIAWDTARISSYVIGGGFIAAWLLFESSRGTGSGRWALLALPVIVLNSLHRYPLMDREIDRFDDGTRLLLYLPAFLLALQLFFHAWKRPGRTADSVDDRDDGHERHEGAIA
jgi:hypothetical protein